MFYTYASGTSKEVKEALSPLHFPLSASHLCFVKVNVTRVGDIVNLLL